VQGATQRCRRYSPPTIEESRGIDVTMGLPVARFRRPWLEFLWPPDYPDTKYISVDILEPRISPGKAPGNLYLLDVPSMDVAKLLQ
jgi:hypothetical protein